MTRKGLLLPSKLGHVLEENPDLKEYVLPEGKFLRYKGRSYCWMGISVDGMLRLGQEALEFLHIGLGDELLSIRSSDIAFTMGAHGPLIEKEKNFKGTIETF